MSTITGRRTLTRFTEWSTDRPFLGGLMLILAGSIIGYVPIQLTVESIMLGGRYTAIGLIAGVLVFLTGVAALLITVVPTRWIRRRLSTIFGVGGMVFSLLSLVGSLGGLFVGLVFGIIGGILCVDWSLLEEYRH